MRQKKFVTSNLMSGDIIAGRNTKSRDGKWIMYLIGSETTHNAMIIHHPVQGICVGDTTPPHSKVRPLQYYEDLMNKEDYEVRVWRIKDATDAERQRMTDMWLKHINGKKYNGWSMKRLWIYKVVPSLPYRIPGHWCTRAIEVICGMVFIKARNIFRKFSGVLKKNSTPKTLENRLIRGLLEDITDRAIRIYV